MLNKYEKLLYKAIFRYSATRGSTSEVKSEEKSRNERGVLLIGKPRVWVKEALQGHLWKKRWVCFH